MRPLRSAALLALLGLAACTPFAGRSTPDDDARLRALYDEMVALIGDAAATSPGQCRALPVGAKACGGPTGFLVYSVAGTDTLRLADLAARHAALQAKLNHERGLASDCAMELPPETTVAGGVCVAVAR